MRNYFLLYGFLVFSGCSWLDNSTELGDANDEMLNVWSVIQKDSVALVRLNLVQFLPYEIEDGQNIVAELSSSTVFLNQGDGKEYTFSYLSKNEIEESYSYYTELGSIGRNSVYFISDEPISSLGEYTLNLSNQKYGSVSAKTKLPEPMLADSVYAAFETKTFDCSNCGSLIEGRYSENQVFVEFKDPVGDNYYMVVIYELEAGLFAPNMQTSFNVNVPLQTAFVPFYADVELNEEYPYYHVAFSDKSFSSQEKVLQISYLNRMFPDNQMADFLAVYSISKEYFDFLFTAGVQKNTFDLPFAEITPVTSNIEDGFGVFGSVSPVAVVPISHDGVDYLGDHRTH